MLLITTETDWGKQEARARQVSVKCKVASEGAVMPIQFESGPVNELLVPGSISVPLPTGSVMVRGGEAWQRDHAGPL